MTRRRTMLMVRKAARLGLALVLGFVLGKFLVGLRSPHDQDGSGLSGESGSNSSLTRSRPVAGPIEAGGKETDASLGEDQLLANDAKEMMVLLDRLPAFTNRDFEALAERATTGLAFQQAVLKAWARHDPGAMFEAAAQRVGDDQRSRELWGKTAISEWIKRDPEGMKAVLDGCRERRGVVGFSPHSYAVRAALDLKDFGLAFDLELRWEAFGSVVWRDGFEKWCLENPATAVEKAARIEGPYSDIYLRQIGKALSNESEEMISGMLAGLGDGRKAAILAGVLEVDQTMKPEEAIALCQQHLSGLAMGKAAGPIIGRWLESDPETALAWAREHMRGQVLIDSVSKAVSSIPSFEMADALLRNMEPGGLKNASAARLLGRELSAHGNSSGDTKRSADEIARWLMTFPDVGVRRAMISERGSEIVSRHHDVAKILASSEDATVANSYFISRTVSTLSQSDHEGTLEWIDTLPERNRGLAREALGLPENDP